MLMLLLLTLTFDALYKFTAQYFLFVCGLCDCYSTIGVPTGSILIFFLYINRNVCDNRQIDSNTKRKHHASFIPFSETYMICMQLTNWKLDIYEASGAKYSYDIQKKVCELSLGAMKEYIRIRWVFHKALFCTGRFIHVHMCMCAILREKNFQHSLKSPK